MPVIQVSVPTGQWEECLVTSAHGVSWILEEEPWVEGTWIFHNSHKYIGSCGRCYVHCNG